MWKANTHLIYRGDEFTLQRDTGKKSKTLCIKRRFRPYYYPTITVKTTECAFTNVNLRRKLLKADDFILYDTDGFTVLTCMIIERIGDSIIIQPKGVGTTLEVSIFSPCIEILSTPVSNFPILVESMSSNLLDARVNLVNEPLTQSFYVLDYEPVSNKYLVGKQSWSGDSYQWLDREDFNVAYVDEDQYNGQYEIIGEFTVDFFDIPVNNLQYRDEDCIVKSIWFHICNNGRNHYATRYRDAFDIYSICLWLEHYSTYWKAKPFFRRDFMPLNTLIQACVETNAPSEVLEYLTSISLTTNEEYRAERFKRKIRSKPLLKTRIKKIDNRALQVQVLTSTHSSSRFSGKNDVFLFNYVSKVLWFLSNRPVSKPWVETRALKFTLPPIRDKVILKLPLRPFQECVVAEMRNREIRQNLTDLLVLNTRKGYTFNALSCRKNHCMIKGGILALPPGTGKTICMLALIKQGIELYNIYKTLVVVPLTLMDQWIKETERFTDLKIGEIHGKKCNYQEKDIVFTTYGTVSSKFQDLNHPIFSCFDRVVFDESHQPKDFRSKKIRACSFISASYRWCISATPYRESSFHNLHPQLAMLNVFPFDNDRVNYFTHIMCQENDHTKWLISRIASIIINPSINHLNIPGPTFHNIKCTNTNYELYDMLFDMVRQKVSSLLDNGGYRYQQIASLINMLGISATDPTVLPLHVWGERCDANNFAITNMEDLCNELSKKSGFASEVLKTLDNIEDTTCCLCLETMVRPTITDCLHLFCHDCIKKSLEFKTLCPQCRKPLNTNSFKEITTKQETVKKDGFLYTYDNLGRRIKLPERLNDLMKKTNVCDKLIKLKNIIDKEKRVVIFSQYNSVLNHFYNNITNASIISGKCTRRKRAKNIEDFKSGKTNVILLSTKVADIGINLTEANAIVFLEPGLESSVKTQAIGRVCRIGQHNSVKVFTMITQNTVEERLEQARTTVESDLNDLMLSSNLTRLTKQKRKNMLNTRYLLNILSL
tara:strand:+ start:8 stop:3001 length:2994 start_codon:yes stop_codon:yes gene_type:complete